MEFESKRPMNREAVEKPDLESSVDKRGSMDLHKDQNRTGG
jgi:hypothetical protein